MSMDPLRARPRQSIISLFDPLASTRDPCTPPRTDSPSSDSDKENENPPHLDLTMSTFFNRTYKMQHQPISKPLRRRLIDVGDVTVDDVDPWLLTEASDEQLPGANDFEDSENDTLTFRDIAQAATPKWNTHKASKFSTPSPSAPRTPLSELPPDQDATPMVKCKMHRMHQSSESSKLAHVEFPQIVVSSADPPHRQPTQLHLVTPVKNEGTELMLSVAPNHLVDSVSSVQLPSSSVSGSLLVNTIIPNVFTPSVSLSDEPFTNTLSDNYHLRPNPSTNSFGDRNRCSMDLQSSFHLQMGDDPEFDLLNDKISFFAASKNGMLSYLDDDPSFDMSFGDSTATEEILCPPVVKPSISQTKTTQLSPESSGRPEEEDVVDAVVPFTKATARSPALLQHTERESCPLKIATPKHSRPVIPHGPPPVVGLRIVKRTQSTILKPTPRFVPASNVISNSSSKKLPVQTMISQPREPTQVRKHGSQAVSATRSRIDNANSRRSAPTSGAVGRTGGPRRVFITDEQQQRTIARGTGGGGNAVSLQAGPRRVPVGERPVGVKGSMSESKSLVVSSIPKAPAQANIGSSLLQPIARSSRLPAPSVFVRPAGKEARRGIPIPIRRAL